MRTAAKTSAAVEASTAVKTATTMTAATAVAASPTSCPHGLNRAGYHEDRERCPTGSSPKNQ